MLDYYKILNLGREANFTAINDAYDKLKRLHAGDSATLQQLEEAWSILANPISRNGYDRALAQWSDASLPAADPPRPTIKQSSNRPMTELIDAAPAPFAAKSSRSKTEIIDPRSPSPPPVNARPRTEIIDPTPPPPPVNARPRTEIIDPTSPAPPANARPRTEIVDYQLTARHDGAGKSPTEIIDPGSPSAGGAPPGASSAPAGSIRVMVTENNNPVAEYLLQSGTHVIGRAVKSGEEPTVKLNDRFVSRRHAIIEITSNLVSITDEGSLNGTRLDGERLQPQKPYKLYDRAIIQVENFVLIVNFGAGSRA